jgi:hypothetical protein
MYLLESDEGRNAHERVLFRAFYHRYPGCAREFFRLPERIIDAGAV